MFRILIGFVIGCFFTFYALPQIEARHGGLERPPIGSLFNDSGSKDYLIGSEPLPEKASSSEPELLYLTYSLGSIYAQDQEQGISSDIKDVIRHINKTNMSLRPMIKSFAEGGISNAEAVKIIERHIDLRFN